MRLLSTASNAASSVSNTRAVPRNVSTFLPAILTTAPSGARLPRRIARPPFGLIGFESGRTTSCPFGSIIASASSPIVLPVTVGAELLRMPASFNRLAISRAPPALYISVATKRPLGFKSANSGTVLLMRSKSSMFSSRPASRAIARRCSTALVEPPVAATDAIALSIESRVMSWRGRTLRFSRSITSAPASRPMRAFSGSSAGTSLKPIAEMPRNSATVDIVFAVNCPPHAPAPGHA